MLFNLSHLEAVEIYTRREDGPAMLTEVSGIDAGLAVIKQSPNAGGNLSLRRGGVILRFSREDGDGFSLSFAQHKGDTIIAVIHDDGRHSDFFRINSEREPCPLF